MIAKATAYRGVTVIYILFKCDVRHRLHCFVCTDTHLFNFTKGKTDLVNQRWRRTTCLQHQCYDVGCYPWNWTENNAMKMIRLQYTLAVKTNLIIKCRNMGYVRFVRYHNSVQIENNIF